MTQPSHSPRTTDAGTGHSAPDHSPAGHSPPDHSPADHSPPGQNPAGKHPAGQHPGATDQARGRWTVAGVLGTVVGMLPHVLHHAGLFAGTALIAGLGGTLLFGVVGLLATVPMLIKLRRRFRSWWAPAIGLLVFVAMFAFSTLVLGPALGGAMNDSPADNQPTPTMDPGEHQRHHPN